MRRVSWLRPADVHQLAPRLLSLIGQKSAVQPGGLRTSADQLERRFRSTSVFLVSNTTSSIRTADEQKASTETSNTARRNQTNNQPSSSQAPKNKGVTPTFHSVRFAPPHWLQPRRVRSAASRFRRPEKLSSRALLTSDLQKQSSRALLTSDLQKQSSRALLTSDLQKQSSRALLTSDLQKQSSRALPTSDLQKQSSRALPTSDLRPPELSSLGSTGIFLCTSWQKGRLGSDQTL
ncbi:uncharacterized protein LOC115382708 [Salarias fasciatus]|uniref:uncharacterized protein LOC115382708 n=1 Tax=Salarias fasciatus TaxID=181472 RepID=UPI0011770477|nr:uncharacterized protein LOC115382708 [Salarias fasciatus]